MLFGLQFFRLCLCLFLLAGATVQVRAADLALVLSDAGGVYGEFATSLQHYLQGSAWRVRWTGAVESLDPAAAQADLLIAVGSEAARVCVRRGEGRPIIATLLPRQAFERIASELGRTRAPLTAITLDQPLTRQIAFLRTILPEKTRLGLLTGADSRNLLAQVRQAASQSGLTLESEDVDTDESLVTALGQLFNRSDVLLALPDTGIYRRDNVRTVLLTSFRHQKPVIGFSQAFVTAGALAALFSSPAQIARQTAELLKQTPAEPVALPAPQSPTYFSLAINRSVAQSLGLNLPDEAAVRRRLGADR